jgi:hypothetical protein
MTKRKKAHLEEPIPDTFQLNDMLDQARPEVYEPRLEKILRLYCKTYDSIPNLPDKVVLQLALWDHLATEIADKGADYFIGCVNAVLGYHLGKQLANTDLI